MIDYSAAKTALASFSKSPSKELGPHGIRVNTISPGPVTTNLWLGTNGVAATLSHRMLTVIRRKIWRLNGVAAYISIYRLDTSGWQAAT